MRVTSNFVSPEIAIEIGEQITNGDFRKVMFVFESQDLMKVDYSMNAGIELMAKEYVIVGKKPTLIPTGLKWVVNPLSGLFGMVLPRSGLSLNTPLRMPNSVGTIEAGYRNEICVMLESNGWVGGEVYVWKDVKVSPSGEVLIPSKARIAQLVVLQNKVVADLDQLDVFYVADKELFDKVEELFPSKRKGGFGSTGVK